MSIKIAKQVNLFFWLTRCFGIPYCCISEEYEMTNRSDQLLLKVTRSVAESTPR